ncbi:hypothetical protein JOF41_000800 [Saccharothrix coeruleofusca]|uniref:hypothetical protein n=1 Tax=Saccharothrix coeruleofusca TaxID=33919 RepID=UPI001AEA068C|nr:hypothetical protein [Saccharothrix coeruleofusca]MBP2334622.1 hypothetical protein [Saccharothrix coeruleofusca]
MSADAGSTSDVGQYAMEQYREQQQGGGGLAGLLTLGVGQVVAAAKALAAATEAQALSVDPHVVDAMLKKLTDMQDALDQAVGRAHVLSANTPLGGGYAEEIGRVNRQLGEQAITGVIPDMVAAIEDLKTQIEKSRASYQNVDEAKGKTFDNL